MYKSLILAVAPTLASAGGHCAVEYHHVIDIRGPGNDDPTTAKCATPLQYAGNKDFATQLETAAKANGGKKAGIALFCGSGSTTSAAKKDLEAAGFTNIVDLGGVGDKVEQQMAKGQPYAGSPAEYKPTLSSIADSCGCLKTAGHDQAHEEKKEAAPAADAHDDHDHSAHGCNTVTIDIRTAKLYKETKGTACAVNVPYMKDDMSGPHPDFVKNYNAAIAPKRRLGSHEVNEMVVGVYCQAASSVTAAMKTLKDAAVDTSKIHNMGGLADNHVAIHASCTCKCPTIMIDIRAADIFKQSDCTSAHSVPYMVDGKPDPKFKDNFLAKLPSNFKMDGTHTVGVFCKAKSSVDAALKLFEGTEHAKVFKNMGGLEMRRLTAHPVKPANNLLNIQTACTCGGGGCGAESKPVAAPATVSEEAQSCTASGKKFDHVIDIRPQHMFDETNADKTIPEQHKQPCATHHKFWVQYEDAVKKEFVENVKKHVNNKLDAPIALYCRGKNGANGAAQMLKDSGFTNVTSLGGLRTGQQPHIADVCQCLTTDGAASVSKKATDAAGKTSSAGYTCASMAVLGTAAVLLQ